MNADLLEKIRTHWSTVYGLALTLLASILTIKVVSDFSAQTLTWLAIGDVGIFLLWLWTRRHPRARSGKVGFAVAIIPEEAEQAKKFASDLSFELSRLIPAGKSGGSFDFVEIPVRIASKTKISDDKALQKLRLKCRATYLMFAHVRIRKHENKDHAVLDLRGAVGHRTIGAALQTQFAQEFSELLPSRVQMPADAELLNCVVTGEVSALVAKYIIGIAAALSSALDFAETLQADVAASIENSGIKNSALHDILRQRVPLRLAEIRGARANFAIQDWLESRNDESLQKFYANVTAIPRQFSTTSGTITYKAIAVFLRERDADGAIALLTQATVVRDVAWYYNMGFLYAYKANMKKAGQLYREAAILNQPPDLAVQLDAFMSNILELEPEKIQLHYCIARINREVRGDEVRTEQQLKLFLEKCRDGQFPQQQKHARLWLAELDEKNQ